MDSGRPHHTDRSNPDILAAKSDENRMSEMCLHHRQPPLSDQAIPTIPTAPVVEQPAIQPPKTDLQVTTSDTSPAQQTDDAIHEFFSDNALMSKPQRPQRVRKCPRKCNVASGKWK